MKGSLCVSSFFLSERGNRLILPRNAHRLQHLQQLTDGFFSPVPNLVPCKSSQVLAG